MLNLDKQHSISTSSKTNQLLASLTELIGRAFIEKKYFQNAQIPIVTLIYLANDLIKALDKKEQQEKMSLAKELTISYKQVMGKKLTKEEQKYDNEIHELDVMSEIMSGVKYATSFSIFKNVFGSISSSISQGLSEHIPAIVGSTAAITIAPYFLSKAIEKVLAKSNLSEEQKNIVSPWLNTLGRLVLAFTPKVEANEEGVNYQYPSTEGHRELFKNINVSVTQHGKNLIGDGFNTENLEIKLRRIQLGENNSVEVIGVDKNDDEVTFNFSERHSDELALSPSLRAIAKQSGSSFISDVIDTAYNYLPTQYTLTNAIIAFGTQKILLQQSPASFLPLLMVSTLFLKPTKAQGTGAVGNEFLVNTYLTNNQGNPKIAKLNDGGFVTVWQSTGQDVGGTNGIYGKRYISSGNEVASPTSGINTALGNEFRINTYTIIHQYPAISALNDGGFVVVWGSFSQDGSNFGVYGMRFASNGSETSVPTSGINTALGNEFRINTYTTYDQTNPSISALNDGGFVVVWGSYGQDGSGWGMYGMRFTSNGSETSVPTSGINTALGNEFRINTSTTINQNYPAVSALNDGGFVVVWQIYQDAYGFGVYGMRFANNGSQIHMPTSGINTALGNEFRINTYTIHDQTNPSVSALNDGGFVIVWASYNQTGNGIDVFGKRYMTNGTEISIPTSGINTALGNEFRINTYTTSDQSYPTVSVLNDGGFVMLWQSTGQDGSLDGVYGKRFAMNGTEIGLSTTPTTTIPNTGTLLTTTAKQLTTQTISTTTTPIATKKEVISGSSSTNNPLLLIVGMMGIAAIFSGVNCDTFFSSKKSKLNSSQPSDRCIEIVGSSTKPLDDSENKSSIQSSFSIAPKNNFFKQNPSTSLEDYTAIPKKSVQNIEENNRIYVNAPK